MKRFLSLLVALMLIMGLSARAYADGKVTYNAKANEFIFEPGTNHSPTSLFEDMQDVMPGDTFTEQIVIKNQRARDVKIKVYMRSLGAQENTDDFLSQMSLTVKQKGDSVLFAAPANETAQLTNWAYLGTIYSGGKITLDVTLEVPITMGDDYQNKIGYIDWEFKVEEFPVDANDPKTGDTSNIFLYSGLMLSSLVCLFIIFVIVKRKKQA